MGNIPSQNRKFVGILQQAINNDVIIVIMTQCREGGVNDLYETGRALVELGADCNKADDLRWTACMFASRNGHAETVRALIELGAECDRVVHDGRTAWMFALKRGHVETVCALIELRPI